MNRLADDLEVGSILDRCDEPAERGFGVGEIAAEEHADVGAAAGRAADGVDVRAELLEEAFVERDAQRHAAGSHAVLRRIDLFRGKPLREDEQYDRGDRADASG